MGFAREATDRVIFMDQGTIVEESPPESLFQAAKTDRAKNFLKQIIRKHATVDAFRRCQDTTSNISRTPVRYALFCGNGVRLPSEKQPGA
jgi:ABC-type dipeptide/oligopeptide/nickel transport system ATPase component